MSFWQGVITVLGAVPEIVKALTLLGKGISLVVEFVDGKLKVRALEKAVDKAQETKDTSDVEAIFNPPPASGSHTAPRDQ